MGKNHSQGASWFDPSSTHPMFLSQLSPSADLTIAVFLTFTGLTSVLGNGMVLLVYCRKRKKLRPSELLTVNLALCDFGFSFFGAPFFIISSLCHAWVFGETGCLWYGIQGFVFGIGSLLTTCLISVDRCLKICCLRYGQWIERRHMSLSIALVWVYTLFWALLPAFGFGSYGAEPYGTSCTINWWRMRSSLDDRIYIFLILTWCFGLPTLAIVTSYSAILLTVIRSKRTLASMPSSSVSHTSKDVRLAKMAAVVCGTFLLAWMPYAAVSLVSALLPRSYQEVEDTLHTTVVDETAGQNASKILDVSSLLNWTAAEYYRNHHYNPESRWSVFNNTSSASTPSLSDFRSAVVKEVETMTRSHHPYSSLPPVVTLIPAMFAKSHSMINPLIYQIMNKEFRDDVCVMVYGRAMAENRRVQRRNGSRCERSLSISCHQSWRRNRSMSLFVERKNKNAKKSRTEKRNAGRSHSFAANISVRDGALDFPSLDTQGNVERHFTKGGLRTDTTITV
ncbi:opsin 9 [Xyrichtys novacula]|uniref:Opsin 9 n=1 Tax=Xyrichtys novacula TaxID=13765 RepID=A0AAV1FM29_XYRNO|nr:opsin 9 [Xyrichtys novacula]